MARPDTAAEQRARYTATVRRSGEHILALLESSLDAARLDAGSAAAKAETCDPLRIANEVADLLRPGATAKSLTLHIASDGSVPSSVLSDPTRLRQILLNLVGNAIKFTGRGSVRVLLRLDDAAGRSPRLALEVSDTGPGLPPQQAGQLFRPFSRAAGSAHTSGTGLGLFISRQLARAMGGDLTARSEPGRGSTFTAVLPVATLPASGTISAPAPAWSGQLGATTAGRVLLADNSPETRHRIVQALQTAGADVSTACDGLTAVAEAMAAADRGHPYDLVLLDIMAPGLDGPSAARRLRDSRYTGQVVILTASADPADRDRCLDAGCDGYLVKSGDPDALAAACLRWLPARRQAA